MTYDAVLIDDDVELIHMLWLLAAKANNKNIVCFSNLNDFWAQADQIALKTPIYIDSQLGNGVLGEDEAQQIYNFGFKTIYLSTGLPEHYYGERPYLKAIRGKEPPWSL